jgi:hypothetical protein
MSIPNIMANQVKTPIQNYFEKVLSVELSVFLIIFLTIFYVRLEKDMSVKPPRIEHCGTSFCIFPHVLTIFPILICCFLLDK